MLKSSAPAWCLNSFSIGALKIIFHTLIYVIDSKCVTCDMQAQDVKVIPPWLKGFSYDFYHSSQSELLG